MDSPVSHLDMVVRRLVNALFEQTSNLLFDRHQELAGLRDARVRAHFTNTFSGEDRHIEQQSILTLHCRASGLT